MDNFIYTAVSGATRNLAQLQISSNNLANVNTEGFRADLEKAQSEQVTGSGYDSRYLVKTETGPVDLREGGVFETGHGLDVAIRGPGLFVLQDGANEVYTRNGKFDVDADGNLTLSGLPVVGETGPIVLPPFSQVAVGDDGTITIVPMDGNAEPMDADRLKLVDLSAAVLRKNEQGFLVDTTGNTADRSEDVQVIGGHLEGSNISAIHEMVSSIALNRQFEAQIKMMKAAENLSSTGNRLIRGN